MTNHLAHIAALLMLVFHPLLATAQQFASTNNVIELDLDNFQPTVRGYDWICMLFYDGHDAVHNPEYFEILQQLAHPNKNISDRDEEMGTLAFTRLDIRTHFSYDHDYRGAQDDSFYRDFHHGFPDKAGHVFSTMNAYNFGNWAAQVYLPARLLLMRGNEYKVYAVMNLALVPSHGSTKAAFLQNWLHSAIQEELNNDDNDGATIKMYSPVERERQLALESKHNKDSANIRVEVSLHDTKVEAEDDDDEQPQPVFDSDKGYFRYQDWSLTEQNSSKDWLEAFSKVIDRYLKWVTGYEMKWDDKTKSRVDKECMFGSHWATMNEQLRELVDRVFANDQWEPWEAPDRDYDETILNKKKRVPVELKDYLEDMVFRYGRSSTSLQWYLNTQLRDKLGETASERRAAIRQNTTNLSDVRMIQVMRGYMKVVTDTHRDRHLYEYPLAELVSEWHNILVAFHRRINDDYYEYRQTIMSSDDDAFEKRKTVPALDMDDHSSYRMLTRYHSFHETLTRKGTPVLINYAKLTRHRYTLDYLAMECGAAYVTSSVYVNEPLLEVSPTEKRWGGPQSSPLPSSLTTNKNQSRRRQRVVDRSLTLQQFIKSMKNGVNNLSLHDFSLATHCHSLLYEDTLYSRPAEQKFRMPSVVAGYDLLQRIPHNGLETTWPSLYIGKRGDNSRLHTERAATGFFMFLVEGKKRWMVAKPSNEVFLYESIDDSNFMAEVLEMDKSSEANRILNEKYPLLHNLAGSLYEVVQEPGQLIYIPPGAPYVWENLEDSVGIAFSIVPQDAFVHHIHSILHKDRAFGVFEMALRYWLFDDYADLPVLHAASTDYDPLYMTFAEYKAQH